MNSEEILVALAVRYNGDYEHILCALQRKTAEEKEMEARGESWILSLELEKYLDIAKTSQYKYTTILSEDYPLILKSQYCAPFVLFYYGDISLLNDVAHNVAVVGSRECSEYGVKMTKSIVKELVKKYNVVSGLAIGIDTVAQTTAIQEGGKTIAVLGSGIDFCYPLRNWKLYEEIKRNHLVISEYPGSLIPVETNFPKRNRIISMISKGVIVTEAHQRSGTLTTVMFALQMNKLVFCVPYPADCQSQCNRLIAEGAYLIENGEEAIDVLDSEIHIY